MTDNKCNPYGQLQIINGKFANKIYSLEPGCFRVGSSAEAEIRIQNNNIQSTQFKIKVDANKLATVCAQSFLFPATKINDKLLRKNKPEVLKPLDIIEFGDVQLQYQNSTLTEKEIKENASSVLKPIIDFDTAKWSARKSPRKLFPHKSGSLATKLKATTPVAKIPNSRLPSTIKIPGLKSLSTPYTTKSNTKTPSIDTRNILTPKQTAVKALKSATKLKYINKFPRQIQNSGKKTFIPKLMSSTKKRKSRLLSESLPKSTVTSASDSPQSTKMNISTNTPLSKIASTCDVSLLENESMVSIGKDLSSPNVSEKSLIDDKESPSIIDVTSTSFTYIKHSDLSNRYLNENDNKKDTNSSNKDVSGIIPFESIFNEQSENKEFEKQIVNVTTPINLEMVKENVQSLDLENVITSNLNINHPNVTVRSKRLLSSNLIDSSNLDELCDNSNKDLSDYDKDPKKIGKPLRRSRIQSLPPSACKSEEFSTENLVTCKSSSTIDDTENKHVEHLDKQSKRCNIRSRHLSFYNENNNELRDKDLPLPYKSCASTQNLLYNYELKKPTFLNSTQLCYKTPANSPIDNSKRMTKHTLSGTGSKHSLLEISSGSVSDGEMFNATSNFTPQIRGKNEIKSKSVERSIRLSKINSVLDKSTSNIIDDAEISVRRRQSELNKYSNIKTYSNKKNTSKVSPQTKLDNLDTTKNNSVTGINSTFILTKNRSQSFPSLETAPIETCLNNSDNFQMPSNEDDANQIQSINIKIATSTPQGEYTKINVKRSSRVSLIENDTSIEETTEDEDQYDTNNDVNVMPTSDTTLDSEKNDSFLESSLQDTSIEIIKDECALVYTINSSTGTSLNESTDSVREENNVAKCGPSSALVTYSLSDNSEPEYYSNVSGTPVKSICKRSKEESSNLGIHEESGSCDLETDDASDLQLSLLEKSESIDEEKASNGEDNVTHNDIKEIKLSPPAHVEIHIEDYDEITAPNCNEDLNLQKKNEPLRKSSLKRFSITEDANNTNDSLKDLNFIKNKNQNDEFLNENNEEENSISIDNNVTSESKSENELKSPNKSSSSSMNQSKEVNITDIDIVSDSSEYGCKQLSFCASPSTSATTVKYGLYTDTESKKTPENDISFKKLNSSLEFYDKHRTKRRGVKRMNFGSLSEKKLKRLRKFSAPIFMSDNDTLNVAVTPKLNQSSQNDSFYRKRSKRSLRKSRLRHSLKTDVGLTGIKRLMATPKLQRSPENYLRDVRGVRRLLTTPKRQISPTNDLHDVRGVKKLLKTPKVQRSPKNELEDMRGVRKLMRNSIARRSLVNDLSDVKGVKRLMRTPRAQKSPYNDLTRVSNIRKLFRTTGKGTKKLKDKAASNNTKTDYRDVRGVKRMFVEEEANQRDELTVSGISGLFDDESSSSQAFDKLINKKHIRTYLGKSPSPIKVRDSLLTTDTVKTPVSRDVFKWVEQQSEFVGKNDESINYNRFKNSFFNDDINVNKGDKNSSKRKGHKTLITSSSSRDIKKVKNNKKLTNLQTSTPIRKSVKENVSSGHSNTKRNKSNNTEETPGNAIRKSNRSIRTPAKLTDDFVLDMNIIKSNNRSQIVGNNKISTKTTNTNVMKTSKVESTEIFKNTDTDKKKVSNQIIQQKSQNRTPVSRQRITGSNAKNINNLVIQSDLSNNATTSASEEQLVIKTRNQLRKNDKTVTTKPNKKPTKHNGTETSGEDKIIRSLRSRKICNASDIKNPTSESDFPNGTSDDKKKPVRKPTKKYKKNIKQMPSSTEEKSDDSGENQTSYSIKTRRNRKTTTQNGETKKAESVIQSTAASTLQSVRQTHRKINEKIPENKQGETNKQKTTKIKMKFSESEEDCGRVTRSRKKMVPITKSATSPQSLKESSKLNKTKNSKDTYKNESNVASYITQYNLKDVKVYLNKDFKSDQNDSIPSKRSGKQVKFNKNATSESDSKSSPELKNNKRKKLFKQPDIRRSKRKRIN